MTRADRDREWATRNERRAATKDNAKKRKAKKKPGRKGCGTKKVAPGRKKTNFGPRMSKRMSEIIAFRKELTQDVVRALQKMGREGGITWFLTGVKQMLCRGVELLQDDPDWLGAIAYEAELLRSELHKLGLHPAD